LSGHPQIRNDGEDRGRIGADILHPASGAVFALAGSMLTRLLVVAGLILIAPASYAGSPQKTGTPHLDKHQVPAGTAFLLTLRTPLDSATAAVDDQVEATLWSPVIQDGLELIPEGALVIGKVSKVTGASKKEPVGSLTFVFSIVQHPETQSIAMVRSQPITITGTLPLTPKGKPVRGAMADATMPRDSRFVALTAEPLRVWTPR
jgi:hypothetical protein